jgi:hypothetical protein
MDAFRRRPFMLLIDSLHQTRFRRNVVPVNMMIRHIGTKEITSNEYFPRLLVSHSSAASSHRRGTPLLGAAFRYGFPMFSRSATR